MRDLYYRSAEEQEAALAFDLTHACPAIFFNAFKWVNHHIVIDDLSHFLPVNGDVSKFEESCGGKIKIYSMQELTRIMERIMMTDPQIDQSNTVFLYPGDGAETVRSLLSDEVRDGFPSLSIGAKRVKDASGAVVGIDTPWDKNILNTVIDPDQVEHFVVVDDVIDTGRTLFAIQQQMDHPTASWSTATPIMFSPLPYDRTSTPSSLEGFQSVTATLILQGDINPAPCNSLSSFVEGGKKTDKLLLLCEREYVKPEQQDNFYESIQALQVIFSTP